MLRLATKSAKEIVIKRNDLYPVNFNYYDNTIRETLSHYPTGHYMSLVSAYTPLSVFDCIGDFRIYSIDHHERSFLNYNNNPPFRDLYDFIERCTNDHILTEITADGHIQFTRNLPVRDQIIVELSPSAAWYLGFKENVYELPMEKEPLKAEIAYPPITLRYLQILCRNVCGTNDSNMTMPTCLGIMHVTDGFTLVNPHIAVNHRINEGRVIDIEILDQDNRPFHWAPVYLELFVSEKAEHEKRQGFFRVEKPRPIHLHTSVRMISIPDIFAAEPAHCFEFLMGTVVIAKINNEEQRFKPKESQYFQNLRGTIMTKAGLVSLFDYLNNYFKQKFENQNDICFIKAHFEGDDFVLTTEADEFLFSRKLFTSCHFPPPIEHKIVRDTPSRFRLDPSLWYNRDTRLELYCMEYHERYPIVSARRMGSYYRIINRSFWTWHELEKPSNVLHFHGERVIVYPDGTENRTSWPVNNELIAQLFYK